MKHQMTHIEALNKAMIAARAYDQWRDHASECEACAALLHLAQNLPEDLRDAALWQIGFNTCTDLIESGQLHLRKMGDMGNN